MKEMKNHHERERECEGGRQRYGGGRERDKERGTGRESDVTKSVTVAT